MKLIIDVDTGMDDAQALMLALRSPLCEVLAVTCVGGNVPLDIVIRNTRLVVAASTPPNRPKPRVFAGCSLPLVSDGPCATGEIRASHYHGDDGIGGAFGRLNTEAATEVEEAINSVLLESAHAALGLVEIVSQHKGEVTLLTLAPLTNIAVAMRLEPQLGNWLSGLIIMGGAHHSLGNNERHLSAEFNFVSDPVAARLVLHELLPSGPRLLVPYEVCLTSSLPFDWAKAWAAGKADDNSLWRRLQRYIVEHQCRMQDNQEPALQPAKVTSAGPLAFRSCDLLAAAICQRRSLIAESFDKRCTIELAGEVTRGQLVVDWFHKVDRGLSRVATAPATFVTGIKLEAYQALLEEILG